MSQSEEPSYYEIALTNRQVLIAFTILLVCMLAAFFAGLWIGRGEVQASVPPAIELAEGEIAPGDDLQEFKFFSEGADDESDAGSAEPAAAQPATQPATQPPAQQPQSAQQPRTLEDEVRGDEQAAPPRTPPPPAARTVAEDPADANPALPRTTVRRPPAAAEELFIQVFSSREEEQAGKVLQRLKGGGFQAFLSPVEVEGQTMFRVRVGPFSDRDAAEEVAGRVRQSMRLDTWITP